MRIQQLSSTRATRHLSHHPCPGHPVLLGASHLRTYAGSLGPPGTLTKPACLPCVAQHQQWTLTCVFSVLLLLPGEEACFNMHLGAYGQAYFAAETMEIVSGEWPTNQQYNGPCRSNNHINGSSHLQQCCGDGLRVDITCHQPVSATLQKALAVTGFGRCTFER